MKCFVLELLFFTHNNVWHSKNTQKYTHTHGREKKECATVKRYFVQLFSLQFDLLILEKILKYTSGIVINGGNSQVFKSVSFRLVTPVTPPPADRKRLIEKGPSSYFGRDGLAS